MNIFLIGTDTINNLTQIIFWLIPEIKAQTDIIAKFVVAGRFLLKQKNYEYIAERI